MGTNLLPSVDSDTKQLRDDIRARIAANLSDPATVEGAAVAAALDSGGSPRTNVSGNAFLGAAVALVEGNQSFAIQATGDSTTVPDTAWFRLLANSVAARFPALVHQYRKWNESTLDFDQPVVLNAPADATRRALVMAAGTSSQRSGPQSPGPNVTGDLDARVNLRMPSYVPGETQAIIGKWTNDASRSWLLLITSTGTLRYSAYNADGSTLVDKISSAPVALADNTDAWIRVVHDVDNGASGNDVKFYTSTDGTTWTQVGTTQTATGVVALNPSTSRYIVGHRGSNSLTAGTKIYAIQVRDGINGPNIVPIMPEHWARSIGQYEPTLEGTPVVTWLMAGRSGGGLGYDYQTPFDTPAGTTASYLTQYMRHMSPNYGQLVTFFSSSHNDYQVRNALWASRLSAWVTGVTADKPTSARIVLTQNPRTVADPGTDGHRARRALTLAWADQSAGVDVIDTYQAFANDGRALSTLVNPADGVHPTGAGYQVWAAAVQSELNAALARVTPTA